jgi:hypothetical protein
MRRLLLLFLFICFIFFAAIGLISCKDTTGPTQEIIFPSSGVTYSKHVGPLFQQKCASNCHYDATQTLNNPTGLNLSFPAGYSVLRSRNDLVDPGQDSLSALVWHIEGKFSLMPPAKSPQLNDNQKNGVKKWINEGAVY